MRVTVTCAVCWTIAYSAALESKPGASPGLARAASLDAACTRKLSACSRQVRLSQAADEGEPGDWNVGLDLAMTAVKVVRACIAST